MIRFLFICALAVMLIILGGLTILHTPPAQRYLTQRLTEILEEALDRDVTIGFLRFTLTGKVGVENFSIANDPAQFPGKLIQVDKVSVALDLLPLLKGKLQASAIKLYRPQFSLLFDELEQDNLPKGKQHSQPQSNGKKLSVQEVFELVSASSIELIDGSFILNFAPENLVITVDSVNAKFTKVPTEPSYGAVLDIHDVSFRLGEILNFNADLTLQTKVNGDGCTDGQVVITVNDGESVISAAVVELHNFEHPNLKVQGSVKTSMAALERMFGFEAPVDAAPQLEVFLSGPAVDLAGSGVLVADGVLIDNLTLDHLRAEVSYRDQQIFFHSILAEIAQGYAAGKGSLCFSGDDQGIQAEIKLRQVALTEILKAYEVDTLTPPWLFAGQATFEFPDFDPERMLIKGRVVADDEIANQDEQYTLTADLPFEVTTERVELRESTLVIGQTSLDLDFFSLDYDLQIATAFTLNAQDVEELTTILSKRTTLLVDASIARASGIGRVTADVQGNLLEPQIVGRLELQGLNFDVLYIQNLDLPFDYAYDNLQCQHGSLESNLGNLSIEGILDLETFSRSDATSTPTEILAQIMSALPNGSLTLEATNLDLDRIFTYLQIPELGGEAMLTLRYKRDDEEVDVSFMSRSRGFRIEPYTLELLTVSGSLQPTGLIVSSIEVSDPAFSFSAQASVAVNDELNLDVKINRVQLEALVPAEVDPDFVTGLIQGTVHGFGRVTDPRFSFDCVANQISILALPPLDLQAQGDLSFTEGLTLTVSSMDHLLTGSGSLSFAEELPFKFNASIQDFDFDPYISALAAITPGTLASHVSGTITVEGEFSSIEATRFEAVFTPFQLLILDNPLAASGPLAVAYEEGLLMISPTSLSGDYFTVTVGGSMTTDGSTELDLQAEVDMEFLNSFSTEIVDASGRAQVQAAISGSIGDPNIRGTLSLEEVSFQVKPLKKEVHEVHGMLEFDGKLVKLEYLVGALDSGFFDASGRIGLEGWLPVYVNVNLKGDDFEFDYPTGIHTEFDARLAAVGQLESLLIDGDVHLRHARYSQRIDYKSMIVEESKAILTLKTRKLEAKQAKSTFAPRFNIHVVGADNLVVKNNIADLELKADVNVQGNLDQPVILGNVEVVDGWILYEDRVFTIQSARVDFIDLAEINPLLDIIAAAEIGAYTLTLELTGKLYGEFSIQLSSDPPLSDIDLWSLFIFGKTLEEMKGFSSAYTATEATSLVTGKIQDEIEKRVKILGGFDEFQITPVFSDSGETAAARFTVKKKIGDRLSVTYSTDMTSSSQQLIIVEYQLSDHLVLMGQRTESGAIGGNFIFKYEFP